MRHLYLTNRLRLGKALCETLGIRSKFKHYCELVSGDKVCWFFGNLLEWDDALPMESSGLVAPSGWRKRPKAGVISILKTIEALLEEADSVVHFGEANGLGQRAVDEVLDYIGYSRVVYRLWATDLAPETLSVSPNTLPSNEDYRYLSNIAYNRSRLECLFALNIQKHLHLPALRRIDLIMLHKVLEREKEIEQASEHKFFEVKLNMSGIPAKSRFTDVSSKASLVQLLIKLIQEPATVVDIIKKEKTIPPPLPLNLIEVQKVCFSQLNFSHEKTLEILESLYEKHRLITYPKSHSRYLSQDFFDNAPEILQFLSRFPGCSDYLHGFTPRTKHTAFSCDRQGAIAIAPTISDVCIQDLSGQELAVFEIIANAYIALFYPAYQYIANYIIYDVGGHQFEAHVYDVRDLGWMTILGKESHRSYAIPPLGSRVAITDFNILQRANTIPSRYTEAQLIASVNRLAYEFEEQDRFTFSSVISVETLKSYNYIFNRGKSVYPTPEGLRVISIVPPTFYDENDYRNWERQLVEGSETIVDEYADFLSKQLDSTSSSLPACPKCSQHRLKIQAKTFECLNCGWVIPNTIASYRITLEDLRNLIYHGYSDRISSLMTKEGKAFSGYLSLLAPDFRLRICYHIPEIKLSESCPRCSESSLYLSEKAVTCKSCSYTIWRTICGHTLTQEEISELLQKGEIYCSNLISKNNKIFDAHIILNDRGETKLRFSRERGRAVGRDLR